MDWKPSSRNLFLRMVENWLVIFAEEVDDGTGKKVLKHVLWKIPVEVVTDIGEAHGEAHATLAKATNEETRTKPATKECQLAFDKLERLVRDCKDRYLKTPPLTEADIISLGLTVKDTVRTPKGEPTAVLGFHFNLKGVHDEVLTEVYAVTGSLTDRENQGNILYRWILLDASAPAPTDPTQLTEFKFSLCRRERFEFPYGSTGKIAYFCARLENGEKKGKWGPIERVIVG